MKFSVVIPTINRPWLVRAVRSVVFQTFEDWELIIVNDNPEKPLSLATIGYEGYPVRALKKIKIINLEKKGGKLIARNTGMQEAQGDWICWLDDDDEYSCRYLEYVAKFANEKSGMAVCNFGMVRYWRGGATDLLGLRDFSQVEFKSGLIATGTFVFKRECLKTTGFFPEAMSPMKFAEMSGIPHYDGSADGKIRPMGNPWGDDFWFFKQLLKHWQSFPLNAYLYFQHVGGGV